MADKVPKKATNTKTPDKPIYDLFTFETEGSNLSVMQHSPDALNTIFGSESPAVNEALFRQTFLTLSEDEIAAGPQDLRGFMPAMVRDIAPRDGIERMLAVQMAVTHVALVRAGAHAEKAAHLKSFDSYTTAYNKLARTYTTQMEALRKHRNGGKQTMTVQHQHVNVEDGGQAIVGHVENGGRGNDGK